MSNTLTITLKQHTPIIHFQHAQPGATLRATEVKPKLDRFIIEKITGIPDQKLANQEMVENHSDWLVGRGKAEHVALDYKLSLLSLDIALDNEVTIIPPVSKVTLISKKIEMTIFAWDEELKNLIDRHLNEFFALNNFGNRQNKAWGSFIPERVKNSNDFEQILANSDRTVYVSNHQINPTNFYNNLMRQTWQILKSGQNHNGYKKSLFFKYMASRGYRWEKRAIKQALKVKITQGQLPKDLLGNRAPVDVLAGETGCQTNQNDYFNWRDNPNLNYDYRFVRFLLGMPEHFEFRARDGYIYQVKPVSQDGIDRFKAPVTFKIFGSSVYAIAEPIPSLLNASKLFNFTVQWKIAERGQERKGEIEDLQMPLSLPDSFNLIEFLDNYFPCVGFNRL